MSISKGYKANFETLTRAFQNNDICLMECTDKKTNKPVMTVCAVQRVDKDFGFVPLARLFDGNPYDELNPPS